MATNQLEIALSVLKELKGNNRPIYSDYNVTFEKYAEIIDNIQIEGLIKNALITRAGSNNSIVILNLDNAIVTIKGEQYLKDNSTI